MNIRNLLIATTAVVIPLVACAEEKESTPPDIPISVDFQSAAVALAVENVQIFAYKNATLSCTEMIQGRLSQTLPRSEQETRALTPCELFTNTGNSLSLELNANYTMLAVAQIGGRDVLAGCAVQPSYGSTTGVEITLSFIDDRQSIPAPKCAKLSDKCNGNPCL